MATKERSPNYPAVSLTQAVEWARKLWELERRSIVPTLAVVKVTGSTTVSGPARSKVAAMRQYGLIDSVGPSKYKVSERTITLALRKPEDDEYQKAMREAALAPTLFKELYEGYRDASEDNLSIHLQQDRKFSPDGTKRVMRAFRDTIEIAKLKDSSYNPNEDEEQNSSEEGQNNTEEREKPLDQKRNTLPPAPPGRERVTYTWALGGGAIAHVAIDGKLTPRALERMKSFVTLTKEALEDEGVLDEQPDDQAEGASE